ncbi:hypothetical protein [Demequina sp. NBRC 110055]|uniref:hypothetical protein n=1 Tax=Demequina sp. NBRC 110055 TaxID=1570344 RepID=UPI000A008A0E|nr:hypothetical protein [Demequina sp. NBRC 110055]
MSGDLQIALVAAGAALAGVLLQALVSLVRGRQDASARAADRLYIDRRDAYQAVLTTLSVFESAVYRAGHEEGLDISGGEVERPREVSDAILAVMGATDAIELVGGPKVREAARQLRVGMVKFSSGVSTSRDLYDLRVEFERAARVDLQ